MQIKTYTKLPVDVEAVEFTGGEENGREIQDWINGNKGNSLWMPIGSSMVQRDGEEVATPRPENIRVGTPGGVVRVEIGEFIIKGVEGEFYPCPASIFEKSYKAKDAGNTPRTPPETSPKKHEGRSEDRAEKSANYGK